MQVYIGKWAGRRWFFPTVFYQNSLRHANPGWHIPEQARLIKIAPIWTLSSCCIAGGFLSSKLAGFGRVLLALNAAQHVTLNCSNTCIQLVCLCCILWLLSLCAARSSCGCIGVDFHQCIHTFLNIVYN